MKKTLLFTFFFLTFLANFSYSSDSDTQDNISLKELSLFAEYNHFSDQQIQHYGAKINLGYQSFSLYYLFSMGKTKDDKFQRHIPLGVYLDYKIIDSYQPKNTDEKDPINAVLMIVLFLLPDGADFNISLTDLLELSPYISWSGVDFNVYEKEDMLISWGCGLRFNLKFSDFYFGPYAGLKKYYSKENYGWVAGFNLGLRY